MNKPSNINIKNQHQNYFHHMAIRLNDPGCQIVAGILNDLSNKNPESDIVINADRSEKSRSKQPPTSSYLRLNRVSSLYKSSE